MYHRTEKQRAAIERQKLQHHSALQQGWSHSYRENPILGGSGHQRYARYVEWCRSMQLPPAPIGTWAAINDRIIG